MMLAFAAEPAGDACRTQPQAASGDGFKLNRGIK
jgi:hypothetical protein